MGLLPLETLATTLPLSRHEYPYVTRTTTAPYALLLRAHTAQPISWGTQQQAVKRRSEPRQNGAVQHEPLVTTRGTEHTVQPLVICHRPEVSRTRWP